MKTFKLLNEESEYKNKQLKFIYPLYVICIDDSKKPKSVLPENWIVEGEEYCVIDSIKLKDTIAFILEDICPMSHIFKGYNSDRFALTDEQIEENIEMQKAIELSNLN